MKYDKKYPDMAYETEEAPPGIIRTKRLYTCFGCRKVTGWRDVSGGDSPGQPCCSDECFEILHAPLVETDSDGVVEGSAEGSNVPDLGAQGGGPTEEAPVEVVADPMLQVPHTN